ncbi:MAG: hypothetical protein FWC89_06175 [Defluviitaleaceae bacterium]|nr:hypothetical protein [Defluviitaleaceae bacterium]
MSIQDTVVGASGAIPRNDFPRMEKFAEQFYESVRNRKSDATKISQNTGISVADVENVRQHIFFNAYDLGGRQPRRFDPDYDQAQSWQRLCIGGKHIREMDIVFLKHEILEYDLMNKQGVCYDDAHATAELRYNYKKYIDELNLKEGVR